jgi:hypothetical protein
VAGGDPVKETLPPEVPKLLPLKVKLDVLGPDVLEEPLVEPLTVANAVLPLAVAVPLTDDDEEPAIAPEPKARTRKAEKRTLSMAVSAMRFVDKIDNQPYGRPTGAT